MCDKIVVTLHMSETNEEICVNIMESHFVAISSHL